jgi:hypothetical protein
MEYSQPQELQQAPSRSPSLEEEDGYSSEQIGGGSPRRRRRSRSATPSETPTRLRVKVTPTTKAGLVAANALERRARLAPDEQSPTPHDPPETSVGPHISGLNTTYPVSRHPSIPPSNIPPSNPDPYAYMTRPSIHSHPSFTGPDAVHSGKRATEADLQLFDTFLHVRPQLSHDISHAPSRTPDPQAFVGPGIPQSNYAVQRSREVSRAPSRTPDPQASVEPGIPPSNYAVQRSRDVSRAPSRTPDPQASVEPGIPPSNYAVQRSRDVSRAPSRTPDPQASVGPSNYPVQYSRDVLHAPSRTPDPQAFVGPGIPRSLLPLSDRNTSLEPSGAPSNFLRPTSGLSPQLVPDPALSTNLRPPEPLALKPSIDLPIPTTQVIPATPAREHTNAHAITPDANRRPVGRKSDSAKDILRRGIKQLEEYIASLAKESGYSVDQIHSKLGTTSSYAGSSWKWNSYLKYFKDNEATEMHRINGESGVPDWESTISLLVL